MSGLVKIKRGIIHRPFPAIVALILLVVVSLSSCDDSRSFDLKLNLTEGETYTLTSTADIQMEQKIEGQVIRSNMAFMGKMNFFVHKRKPETYELKLKFEKLNVNISSPLVRFDYNSSNPDTSDINALALTVMLQKELLVEMDYTGNVIGILNIQEIFDSMVNSFPYLSDEKRDKVIATLTQAYGEEAIISNMELATYIFPDKKIKVGDTWNTNVTLSALMSATMKNKFKLISYGTEIAELKGVSDVATTEHEMHKNINGTDVQYDLGGEMISEIKIDATSGWVISANIEQSFTGEVVLRANPGSPKGMKFPTTWRGKVVITGHSPE